MIVAPIRANGFQLLETAEAPGDAGCQNYERESHRLLAAIPAYEPLSPRRDQPPRSGPRRYDTGMSLCRPDRCVLTTRRIFVTSENDPIHASSEQNRREFLKLGAVAGLGAALGGAALTGCATTGRRAQPAPRESFAAPPMERVRIGFVGVGGMGSNHVNQFLKIDGAEIHAVCDIVPEKLAPGYRIWSRKPASAVQSATRAGRVIRAAVRDGRTSTWSSTATPWGEWHVPSAWRR